MKKLNQNKIKALLLGASALALMAEPASAGYIQTLGLGQKTSSLAGATTATADDFDAFYVNPAGAANFTTPVIGFTAKLIDTTNVDVNDGAGSGIKDTWKGEGLATAPALGAYLPVMPGSIVMGLGIGAPFALAADYNDQAFGATVTNNSSSNIELLYIEATPTIAMKVNDRLNVGLGVNIGWPSTSRNRSNSTTLRALAWAASWSRSPMTICRFRWRLGSSRPIRPQSPSRSACSIRCCRT